MDGHPPFTCSAWDDTFVDDEDDPDPDEEEEEEEEEEPLGFVGSELPPTSVPLAPEQAHAPDKRRKSEAEDAMRQPNFMRRASAIVGPAKKPRQIGGSRHGGANDCARVGATATLLSTRMVSAPLAGGRGPLPIPIAIVFLLVGPLLLWLAFRTGTEEPKRVLLSCTRERADLIVCQPGNVRGPQAIVRSQTGKNAKTCFTLGDTWMNCGGDVQGAAARVNALPVGAKADVDVTPAPPSAAGMAVAVLLAVVMIVVGAHRLLKGRG